MEVAPAVAVLELNSQGCLVRPISKSAIVLFLRESTGSGAVYSLAAIPRLLVLRDICVSLTLKFFPYLSICLTLPEFESDQVGEFLTLPRDCVWQQLQM